MSEKRRGEVIQLKTLEVQPDEASLEKLYLWVDEIPLSRPKKNLSRDFSDGVMTAELIQHFIPKIVDIHNYNPANSTNQKEYNWYTLTKKVFLKINLDLTPEVIRALAQCRQWVAENFLIVLREKIDVYLSHKTAYLLTDDDIEAVALLDQPEVDQHTSGMVRNIQPAKGLKKVSNYNDTQQRYSPSWVDNPVMRSPRKVNTSVEMVPVEELQQKELELQKSTQAVEALQAKIEKLEHLLQLKDLRIEDLAAKLDQMDKQFKIQRQRQKQAQHGPTHLKSRKA